MNDFGNKQFRVWWDAGLVLEPTPGSGASNNITIDGVPTPYTSFESENFRRLGIENSRTIIGSIMVMRYDNSSKSAGFDQYLSDECLKDLQAMNVSTTAYRNQELHGKTITVATVEDFPFTVGNYNFKVVHRSFSEARVLFGNFVVVLLMDSDHFNETLNSLSFQDLRA
jgi:hypothetical protein